MLEFIMNDLMMRTQLAGAGVGLLAGMLGSFVVWRRMAYLGDAMGHAALLGVVAGLLFGISPVWSVMGAAVIIGLALSYMERDKRLPFDALLVVIATGALSAGLALYAYLPNRQVDVMSYLFGDVLAVSIFQLAVMYGVALLQGLLIWGGWRTIMRVVVHESVAQVESLPVRRIQLCMMISIAATVALTMQVVGVLLMTAMLVIPALAARMLARSPAQMVVGSCIMGVASALLGIEISWQWDISTGPSMVLGAVAMCLLAACMGKLLAARK